MTYWITDPEIGDPLEDWEAHLEKLTGLDQSLPEVQWSMQNAQKEIARLKGESPADSETE